MGSDIDLYCAVSGYPTPEVTWDRVEGPLPAQHSTMRGRLRIRNIRPEDSGTYRCTASNPAGSTVYRVDFNVIDMNTPITGPITGPITNDRRPAPMRTEIYEGERVELECVVTSQTGYDRPTVQWRRDNGLMPDHVTFTDSIMIFNDAKQEDSGVYNCYAINQGGAVVSSIELIVIPRRTRFAPVQRDYTTAALGSPAQLRCEVHGTRQQRVSWVKADGQLPDEHSIDSEGDLYIPRVREEDGGRYECQTRSQFGPTSHPVVLVVGCGISEIKIKGQNMNLGAEALEIIGVDQYDVCHETPCQNNGRCTPWNNRYGFVCECQKGYTGERCEILGERCYYGACGTLGTCVNTPGDSGFSCICPLGMRGELCEERYTVRDPAFNKTSFISYPTIKDGLLTMSLMLTFKPRSLDDGIVLYNSQQQDGNKDFVAIVIKDRYLEFRFSAGYGMARMQSRQPLRKDEWVRVQARRTGYDGLLIVNNEEPVTAQAQPDANSFYTSSSWSTRSYYGGNTGDTKLRGVDLHGPLYLGGVDPTREPVNQNVGTSQGFVGCKDCSQQVTICDTDDPCQNGAGCVALADGGYRCNCPLGFMGPSCEA
ncbi:basement membrane-specific heparan sulfate proteoglycan core protein, partial [Elysia marginata]